jgi:predicted transposase YbfD/YdcC
MDYTTWTTLPAERREEPLEALSPIMSLYETLQGLPDPRRGQGKRYELALLVCLLLVAKLAGQTTLSGATEWLRHRGEKIAEAFGLRRKQMPCQMTYCRMLACLDGSLLDELLAAFFIRFEAEQRCGREPSRLQTQQGYREHAHLAIDGKTVCATSSQAHQTHLLSCYDVATGTVLWQHNVGEKQNEISALKPLITPALVKGRILTLDAMHTQRELCAQVDRWEGDYILMAKNNQPTLAEDIADLFADRTPDRRRWVEAETWEKGHGRLEYRHITCSPDLNSWFGKQWQGIEQVFQLERVTCLLHTSKIRCQVVYGLSSLPMSQIEASRMLELVRQHWAIENRLHWRRDVTLGEDACQTRTGPMPSVLARLNNTLLSLMDRLGVKNVARQLRYFDAHVEQAVQLLLTGRCVVF